MQYPSKISIFKDKIVFITGGTGSIGSQLVRQLVTIGAKEVRVYSRDEFKHFLLQQELQNTEKVKHIIGDIRDYFRLEETMQGCNFVFHTAAMKHICFCENNLGEAIKTNIIGSQNVVRSAIKNKVSKVIGISTDKAVNPTTFMGKTKLVMEGIFTSQNSDTTQFSIVRLGNIINSRGSVIPLWVAQIQRGLDITITDKRMMRYLVKVESAAKLIIKAGEISRNKEIFVLKMEEKNIFQLAKNIVKKYANGNKIKVKVIGIRYGEKLREDLLTEEEKSRCKETKDYYIISPNNNF